MANYNPNRNSKTGYNRNNSTNRNNNNKAKNSVAPVMNPKKNVTSKVNKNNTSKPTVTPITIPKAMNNVPIRTTHSKGRQSWSPLMPKPVYGDVNSNPNKNGVKKSSAPKKRDFMTAMNNTRNSIYGAINSISITENGAIGFRTTGSELLDMNFQVASLRKASDKDIISKWRKVYAENPQLALRWLFYARDIRGGLGERRLFRIIMNDMARNGREDVVNALIPLFPEYGRFDDLWELLHCKATANCVLKFIHDTLREDIEHFHENKSISLLAKWLPSANASSNKTKTYAGIIRKSLNWTPRQYQQTLSNLRKYLDVVEIKMSNNEWNSIDYETVPSRAGLVYNKAFLRHDETRRRAYLDALSNGEVKINSSVLFPHDIVQKYCSHSYHFSKVNPVDEALEGMWRSLPDLVNGNSSTICVADGSGSMVTNKIGDTNIPCLSVANALAIYFAERCKGAYKDKYITFSMTPKMVNLSNYNTLHDKLVTARKHNEVANTNIEAVFDLILNTAIRYNMTQDELPQNILVLSDMEFDSCARSGPNTYYSYNSYHSDVPTKALFKVIADKFTEAGYIMPRLVFWNLNSRTKTIPLTNHESGVALVSGFSPNTLKMVMQNKTDPYDCLVGTIMDKRYNAVTDNLVKAGLIK